MDTKSAWPDPIQQLRGLVLMARRMEMTKLQANTKPLMPNAVYGPNIAL